MNQNLHLHTARVAKQDEFYTQYEDIQKEVETYLKFDPDTFRDKIVYCNCDDPFESNFFKYFATNFNRLGLKRLITTSYDSSTIAQQGTLFPEDEANDRRQQQRALAVVLDHVDGANNDGTVDITDVELFLARNKATMIDLKRDCCYAAGDFRSSQCVEFLKQADIVVTNPPFSLFREYVAQLIEHEKKFIILGGNLNAVTYTSIFPLIKDNKLWLGATCHTGDREFRVPDHYPLTAAGWRIDEHGVKYIRVKGVRWFTNLDYGRRHPILNLKTKVYNLKFSRHAEIRGKVDYDRYDNFDAIEVPYIDAIPSDHDGLIGVPITFLDKYNPDQFEIIGLDRPLMYALTGKVSRFRIHGKEIYARIVIRHRHPAKASPR